MAGWQPRNTTRKVNVAPELTKEGEQRLKDELFATVELALAAKKPKHIHHKFWAPYNTLLDEICRRHNKAILQNQNVLDLLRDEPVQEAQGRAHQGHFAEPKRAGPIA